ncbi:MAG TPA: DUF4175 family protein [Caulobacterales bacterium]|nr:DUF4175 family protein [Caulobacterales bacterium]
MKLQDALDQLARETQRARRHMAIERAARVLWPLALAMGLWALIALTGLHEALPLIAQSLTAVAALALFVWLALKARHGWRAPTELEARTRLAVDCAIDPGAFEALGDRPTRYDPTSMALWRREQDRARARVEKVRAGPTRLQLGDLDPLRLRFVLPVLLLAALIYANEAAPDRLANAFLPDPGPLLGDGPMQVEAWATPAAYTHAGPVSLSDRLGQRVETPPSIEATVRVTGPAGAPRLVFQGQGGRREARFTRAADGAWEAHLAIPGQGQLKIVRFHTRGFWRMAPAPDNPPTAIFAAPLTTLPQERVSVAWSAEDDYGVTGLALRVRPVHAPEGLRGAPPQDVPFESPAGDPKDAQGQSTLELAPHPYAGMEVEARVVAFDALGQAGESTPLRFTMPEKVFLQPLARAAIEIRRDVLWERRAYQTGDAAVRRSIPSGDILLGNQRIDVRDYEARPALRRAPPGVKHAARLIDALTMAPEDGYFKDLAVYLGLREAHSQLEVANTIGDTNLAADTLWRTALRAEYGGAADARTALEMAQRALSEALQSGASQDRIRQLMEAMRQATQNYLQALVQEAVRQGRPQNREDTQEQTELTGKDIQDMMDQVQRLTEQGRTQEAQALLQQLAQMLSNLDVQLEQAGQSQQGQGQRNQDQQAQQSMDQLSQTIGEQRALRDQTQQQQQGQQQQQQQQPAQGGSGGDHQGGVGGGPQDLAQRQAQLRDALGEVQRMAGSSGAQASDELNNASQAMQRAENALRQGDFNAASAAQDAALQNLRNGADQLAAALRQNGRQGQPQQGANGPRDPLGRVLPGAGSGEGDTRVPTQMDPARVRDIVNEIRRRAQDPNRPEAEREYLRRLLDRFSGS